MSASGLRPGSVGVSLSVDVGRALPAVGGLSVAAVNGPNATVVAGDEAALEAFRAECEADGVRARRIPVDYASHCSHVEVLEQQIVEALHPIRPIQSRIPLISTVTGETIDTATMDAAYWYRNLRRPVLFDQAVTNAPSKVFIEVSAHPVLVPGIDNATGIGTLRRDEGGLDRLALSAAEAHVNGVPVDFEPFNAGGRIVDLPTYPFQHHRYWPDRSTPILPAAGTTDDTGFWDAVEREDTRTLIDTLGLPADPASLETLLPALSAWRRRTREHSTAASWRYRVTWKPVSLQQTPGLSGTWLVITPPATSDTSLVTDTLVALSEAGARAVRVEVPTTGASRAELAELIGEVAFDEERIAGVLSLPITKDVCLSEATTTDAVTATADDDDADTLARAVALIQALGDAGVDAPLWLATREGVATGRSDPAPRSVQAALWGLGRVAALEQPHRWGGLIDLPASLDARARTRLAALLSGTTGEDQLALRATGPLARRLERAPAAATRPSPHAWPGTTLITGGTGAVGGHVARWLAGEGAEHLLLVSRRGPDAPGAADLASELRAAGATVTVAACDIAAESQLAHLLAGLPADRPLNAIMHTAAVLDDGVLDGLTRDSIETVLAPKTRAALNLHAVAPDVETFVLFSSLAGTLGNAGQGAYAAANAYLDALAEHRRAQGKHATSIAWGAWGQGGLAEQGVRKERLRRGGLAPMDPKVALTALASALDATNMAIVDVDWSQFAPAFTGVRPNPSLLGVQEAARAMEAAPRPTANGLRDKLRDLPRSERLPALVELVRAQAAAVLGHASSDAVDPARPFQELGFDSLTSVELRNLLSSTTGLPLPSTLVFDHPTPAALAAALLRQADEDETFQPQDEPLRSEVTDDPVVIVGMACRFPGGVASPDELWHLIRDETDAVAQAPRDRGWNAHAAQVGGFLDGSADFDAAFFNISPREALAMDPQQRLLLETAWETFEHAGIDPAAVRGGQVGVFVGASGTDYGALLYGSADGVEGHMMTGNAGAVVSGRISYVLGLEGPAVTVDTACSSSLVALHLAAQSVRQGECAQALVGGVTVMATEGRFVEFGRQGGLAADGRCKAFAEAADGTGWGEGAAMLLVERLSEATLHNHQVLAVLKGSAVNQDGASNGLTAPNGPSQQRVIRRALAAAGLTAGEVDAVEAHGTGTTLGDPIEAQALLATYGQDRAEPLWLGSVKSNLGHTQAAAGLAGVMKMVLAMRHGVLPRTLHVDAPTSHVDWSAGAVRLLTESREWRTHGTPRRAGVSSFGISGTNAHVILEEAPARRPAVAGGAPPVVPWVMSGKSPEALTAQAGRLLRHVAARPELDAVEVAYALAAGRSQLEHRAVVLGADRAELLESLAARSLVTGTARGGKAAFLFSGQGAQRPGMGRELHAAFPVFAEAFDEVCAHLDVHLDRPISEILDSETLHQTVYTQAGLFAVEVALFRLMAAWGVRPDVVMGHSIGELAAAHVAGMLSLEDAAKVVTARGRFMQALPEGGAMVAVQATEAEVLAHLTGGLAIAAVNGPRSVVLSGDEAAVLDVAGHFAKTKRLTVSHAFHSPLMGPMLDDFRAVVASVTQQAPTIPIVSNLTGELVTEIDWVAHVTDPVRFADGIETLNSMGVATYLELGPDGVLTAMAQDCLPDTEYLFTPVMRKDRREPYTLMRALTALHTRGVGPDWKAVLPAGPHVDLPTYAFQRERFWPSVGRGADVDAWRYNVSWEPVASSGRPEGEWLIVRPGVAGAPLGEGLDAVAEETLAAILAEFARYGTAAEVTTATDPVLAEALAGGERFNGILSLLGLDERPHPDYPAVTRGTAATLDLIRALEGPGARLWCLTRGAVSTGAGDPLTAPDQAAIWGLGRVAALEYPQRWGGLVDLPGQEAPASALAHLGAALTGPAGEDQLALRPATVRGPATLQAPGELQGPTVPEAPAAMQTSTAPQVSATLQAAATPQAAPATLQAPAAFQTPATPQAPAALWARRLTRAPLSSRPSPVAPAGTVLITGGTGVLGARVARWLADRGAGHLLLLSRSGDAAPEAASLRHDLGDRVTIRACDVADKDALAQVIAAYGHDITAVVHTAGVGTPGALASLELAEYAAVAEAKVAGARNLDELLADRPLEAFVLYSSIAGVWGSGTQGAYAAANATLDAIAENRRARGLAATSVAWGPWDEGGMADGAAEELRKRGLAVMDPQRAMIALGQALDHDATCLTVADVDWARFLPVFTFSRPSPLLAGFEPSETFKQNVAAEGDSAEPSSELAQTLAGLSGDERERLVLELVRGHAATALGHVSPSAVDVERGFMELGFDSLTGVEFRNALKAATGVALPSTAIFDHPSPVALAGHLLAVLTSADDDGGDAAARRALATVPIAALRGAGLLDALLELANGQAPPPSPPDDEPDDLGELDVDDLVRMALEGNPS
ncbi:SDR family NAD(P)-dependent oxidoreductase [Nonomuraea sp. NBC_01738]|uniref:SDR family NAD(P)-dependent oxidoreductase n=1 Tax=Nonomuraea sp. NBC_01738 TaxID=2976003 RepID=UPI002E128D03|nr:SDR family NAD(P)-dependent oxidoreductase [Nonomuraea sp. NBC_01738]